MRKKLITLTTAGLIAVGGAAVAVPALAATDTTNTATATPDSTQVEKITEALAGLVTDGSITQEQAEKVASTLDAADLGGGHGGGHGGGRDLSTAATTLNMTEDDLRTALQADGATLATVADAQGVSVGTLIDALVTAGQERITQAVADGEMTQEQADQRLADLQTRVTDRVNSTGDDRPQRSADTEDDTTE